jgi:hypothetical protein
LLVFAFGKQHANYPALQPSIIVLRADVGVAIISKEFSIWRLPVFSKEFSRTIETIGKLSVVCGTPKGKKAQTIINVPP